ncbi:helix-turn-helix domain-containing protein [Flagellimonas oceanensis]|uniref:helix-turn-helix domain-containing protein n=1 Tax=Flagellimonas oceanensis TaxID=2499163 RepID=UPI003BACA4E4
MHVYEFPEQDTLDKLRNLPDREQGDIEWPNVIANVSTKSHEKHIIESSFSLFTNINGTSRIRLGNKELSICEQTLFLGNPFESFHYHIDSTSRIETLNVHLNHGTYTRVMYALTQSHETLLDRPTGTQTEYRFSDQLHYKDQRMAQLLSSFQTGMDEGFFMALIQYCLVLDQREKGRSLMVAAAKKSTRDELGKRMARARDHLYGRYMDTTLSVTDVAGEVGMSPYHFIRVFKSVYGVSPYRFIKAIRVERAAHLLRTTSIPVKDIALEVGFEEANALYPVFKDHFHSTPQAYRKKLRNFQ